MDVKFSGHYSYMNLNKWGNFQFFISVALRSSLCDYTDAYIHINGTIAAINTTAQGQSSNCTNKKVIFKNCALFTKCISRINNTQVDDTHNIDVVMSMYNLIKYIANY